MDPLKTWRDQLDQLDTQIALLLNQRMHVVDQIGRIKNEQMLHLTDKNRENEVLHHVEDVVEHPVLKEHMGMIYKAILEASRNDQQFSQLQMTPFRRIGIIGLGLMGGSICKALKMKDPIIEIDTLRHLSEDDLLASQAGVIHKVHESLTQLMQSVELIILATPISTVIPFAREIRRQHTMNKKLLVMDIGSVKGEITHTFEQLTDDNLEFVATHPMAGKEKSGFKNSQGILFVHSPWIVVPHKRNQQKTIDDVMTFVRYLGAEPLCLDATIHDSQAALVSHLPAILSRAFVDFVNNIDPESIMIAGPGFKGFTRLAQDNREMQAEIAYYNRQSIRRLMEKWMEYLDFVCKGNEW